MDHAIKTTCRRFPEIEGAKTALAKWTESDAFIELFEQVHAGEHRSDKEIVDSFVDEGEFYLPSDEDSATGIVAVFLMELRNALLRSDEGRVVLANRQEILHTDTRNEITRHIDTGLANLANILLASPAPQAGLADPEALADPAHVELTAQIDLARDLLNEGRVSSARVVLEKLREETETIPAEIEFRIVTNLGACALADDDTERARALLEEAHRLQPDNQKGIANAATAAHLGKDLERAEALARKVRISNPRDSQATSVLMWALWEAGKGEQFEEIITAEDWIPRDRQCGLALAEIRIQQSRFEEAFALCRSLIEADPADPNAHLALGEWLIAATQAVRGLPVDPPDETLTLLREAEEEATRAIDLLRPTELKARLWRALLARAIAHIRLGETAEAMVDLNEVLDEAPTHINALFNKGLLLLDEGRPADARAVFERIPSPERHPGVVVPFAVACLESGDSAAAVGLLKGTVSLEDPSWQDVRRAAILSRAEAAVADEDSVGPLLEIALKHHPQNPFLLLLAAERQRFFNDPDGAEKLLLEALKHTDESDRRDLMAELGSLYQELGRFADAAERYAEAVDGVAFHPAAVSLLVCLNNSRQLGKALDWARRLRTTHRQVPKLVLEIEVQILAHVGDASAALLCQEDICSRTDAAPLDRVKLASAHLRCGQRDAAVETILGIDVSELCHEPQEILKLAQLKLLLGVPNYLDDAYLARRWGDAAADVHLGYFQLFHSQEKTWVEPETVGPGCAVLLKSESNEQWWQILNDGEERRGSYELPRSDDFARRLLGKRVGDTVLLREDVEELSYEITAVQSKFVRAFQETCQEFSTRFPENMGLSRVAVKEDDFTKVLQSVDQHDQVVREVERLYRKRQLPFTSFANFLGRSALEVWRECTRGKFLPIHCGTGSPEEATTASTLPREADGVILDLLALLTVHELGLAEQLRSRFSRVAVPQYVIDEIQQLVYTTTVMGPIHGYMGKSLGGQYTLAELSEEDWTSRLEYIQSVLNFAESFERIASYRILEPNTEEFEKLVDVVALAGAGWICARDEQATGKLLLVSDDIGLSSVAHSLGIDAVNTQAALEELRRSEVITDEAYSSWIEQLVLLNYWFVRIQPEDIVRRLEANGYRTTDGMWGMLRTLEGPDCTEDAAVAVGARVIALLARRALLPTQIEAVLSAVIAVLQRGRENSSVLVKFKSALAPKLELLPLRGDPILATVDLHIRLPKG